MFSVRSRQSSSHRQERGIGEKAPSRRARDRKRLSQGSARGVPGTGCPDNQRGVGPGPAPYSGPRTPRLHLWHEDLRWSRVAEADSRLVGGEYSIQVLSPGPSSVTCVASAWATACEPRHLGAGGERFVAGQDERTERSLWISGLQTLQRVFDKLTNASCARGSLVVGLGAVSWSRPLDDGMRSVGPLGTSRPR